MKRQSTSISNYFKSKKQSVFCGPVEGSSEASAPSSDSGVSAIPVSQDSSEVCISGPNVPVDIDIEIEDKDCDDTSDSEDEQFEEWFARRNCDSEEPSQDERSIGNASSTTALVQGPPGPSDI